MKSFRLMLNNFEPHWDRAYGMYSRDEWSVCVGGSFVVEFEPSFCRAVQFLLGKIPENNSLQLRQAG